MCDVSVCVVCWYVVCVSLYVCLRVSVRVVCWYVVYVVRTYPLYDITSNYGNE